MNDLVKRESNSHIIFNAKTQQHERIDLDTGISTAIIPATKMTVGFSQDTAALICELLREGRSIKDICSREDMPALGTIYLWRRRSPRFKEMYDAASAERAEAYHDRVLDIAEDLLCAETKNQIDALKGSAELFKWAAEKGDRRRYGQQQAELPQSGFTFILNTGIHNTPSPDNIEVDEQGNLKGVHDGKTNTGNDQWGTAVPGRERSGKADEITDISFEEKIG